MLQKSRFHPPRPFAPVPALPGSGAAEAAVRHGEAVRFVSAEDFDATGILVGCDPCASNYWWMPELHGPDADAAAEPGPFPGGLQATRRAATGAPRSTAAA